MRFSIITITYNSEKYLAETIESIVNQTFENYEHIIWDGGSTDQTLKIIQKFPHIHLYQGKDSGISDAMNKGASYAKGDYLLHLHSDDLLHEKNSLEIANTFFEQHPHALWAYGKSQVIDSQGNPLRTPPLVPFCTKRLHKYNIIPHPATFISRKLFLKSGGFSTQLKYCMDYDLWLRLSQLSPAQSIPHTFAKFREHSDSLSTRDALNVCDEAYLVRKQHSSNIFEHFRNYRTWRKRRKNCLKNLI